MSSYTWRQPTTLVWVEGDELAETRCPATQRREFLRIPKSDSGDSMWAGAFGWQAILDAGWVPMSCAEVYRGVWPFRSTRRQWVFLTSVPVVSDAPKKIVPLKSTDYDEEE